MNIWSLKVFIIQRMLLSVEIMSSRRENVSPRLQREGVFIRECVENVCILWDKRWLKHTNLPLNKTYECGPGNWVPSPSCSPEHFVSLRYSGWLCRCHPPASARIIALSLQSWCWTELFTSRAEFLWIPVSFSLYKCAPLRHSVCCLSDAHSLSPAFAASFPSFTATSQGLSTHSTSQLGRAMPFFLKSNGRRYSYVCRFCLKNRGGKEENNSLQKWKEKKIGGAWVIVALGVSAT